MKSDFLDLRAEFVNIVGMILNNANILVIDDDEDVLVALRLLLKSKVKEVVSIKPDYYSKLNYGHIASIPLNIEIYGTEIISLL